MKSKFLSQNYKYLTLLLGVLVTIFSIFPLVNIQGIRYDFYKIFSHSTFPLSLKIILAVLLVLPLGLALLNLLHKKKIDALLLAIITSVFTILLLLPTMYETIVEEKLKLAYGAILILILLGFTMVIYLANLFSNVRFSIKDMVEVSVLVALAVIFDFFPKIKLSGGAGSISLTMLPLFIIALRFNFTKAFIANGIIYGLLTCLFDGYGFATYPFDYLLGFGLIATTALFKNRIMNKMGKPYFAYIYLIFAIILATILRVSSSTLSSIVIYQYSFEAGLIYNLTYMLPSFGIILTLLILLLPALQRLNKRFPRLD